jgi:transcriptional regulator with XRE-family HTH domain
MLIRDALGEVLRRVRLQRAKTLQQLSDECQVSLPYLSEIERGRKEVSSEVLATICRSLDVPITSVLYEASELLELNSVRPVVELSRPSAATELLLAA